MIAGLRCRSLETMGMDGVGKVCGFYCCLCCMHRTGVNNNRLSLMDVCHDGLGCWWASLRDRWGSCAGCDERSFASESDDFVG